MINLRNGVLAVSLLLGAVACATQSPWPDAAQISLASKPADAILAPVDGRWQDIEEIRALGRISITSAQGRYTTRQTLFWHRPSLLRIDTVGIFGQPLMTLVADAARVSIYYPQQSVFFDGPATAPNLAQFIGLPLASEDVARLLTGYIRPSFAPPAARIHSQVDRGMYLLRFLQESGELLQDVWMEPHRLLPTRVIRYGDSAEAAIDILYGDFRPLTEALSVPFQLVIWLPGVETEVRIQFLTVEVNPGLDLSTFYLLPPKDVRVIPLE